MAAVGSPGGQRLQTSPHGSGPLALHEPRLEQDRHDDAVVASLLQHLAHAGQTAESRRDELALLSAAMLAPAGCAASSTPLGSRRGSPQAAGTGVLGRVRPEQRHDDVALAELLGKPDMTGGLGAPGPGRNARPASQGAAGLGSGAATTGPLARWGGADARWRSRRVCVKDPSEEAAAGAEVAEPAAAEALAEAAPGDAATASWRPPQPGARARPPALQPPAEAQQLTAARAAAPEPTAAPTWPLVATHLRRARALPRVEIVAGGMGVGDQYYQLHCPFGIAVCSDGSMLVADTGNCRVVRWPRGAEQGQVLAPRKDLGLSFQPVDVLSLGGGSMVISTGEHVELWARGTADCEVIACGSWPTGLALEDDGAVVFTDTFDNVVTRCHITAPGMERVAGVSHTGWARRAEEDWQARVEERLREPSTTKQGQLDHHLDAVWQLRRPFGVAAAPGGAVLVADSGNHRVTYWARGSREGVVVAGGRGQGSRLDQLNYPRGVVAEGPDALLVADTFNDRVVRWVRGARRGEVVAGGCGRGCRLDQLNRPAGLALDGQAVISMKPAPEVVPRPALQELPWARDVLESLRACWQPSTTRLATEELFGRFLGPHAADGCMSMQDFDRVVRAYRPELFPRHVQQLFALVNESGTGKITLAEFTRRFGSNSL